MHASANLDSPKADFTTVTSYEDFTMLDASADADLPRRDLQHSPFARVGESLFRREILCEAQTQTEGRRRKAPNRAVMVAFAGMFVAVMALAGLTSVLLYQQHNNSELERRITLQSARIRELEAKISTLRNYVPLHEAPREQQQEPSDGSCFFDIKLGPCGQDTWNQLIDATGDVVKDLSEAKQAMVDVFNAFAKRLY